MPFLAGRPPTTKAIWSSNLAKNGSSFGGGPFSHWMACIMQWLLYVMVMGACTWCDLRLHDPNPFAIGMLWKFSNIGLLVISPTATVVHLLCCSTRYTSCSKSNICKGSNFLALKTNPPQLSKLDLLQNSYPDSQYVWVSVISMLQSQTWLHPAPIIHFL